MRSVDEKIVSSASLMWPWSGVIIPARQARRVDFPAPDGPNTAVMPSSNWPATSRVKSPWWS